jgi:hypothetical protein
MATTEEPLMQERFAGIGDRLGRIEGKIDGWDGRLTAVETTLNVLADPWENRFVSLESRLNGMLTLHMTWITILIGIAIAVLRRS